MDNIFENGYTIIIWVMCTMSPVKGNAVYHVDVFKSNYPNKFDAIKEQNISYIIRKI